MSHIQYLLYAKLISLAIGSWLSYVSFKAIARRRHHRKLAKGWNCKPAAKYKTWDPIFGLDFLRTYLKEVKKGNVLEFGRSTYKALNVNTMRFPILTASIISTQEPENIKSILATNFDSYGIAYLRTVMAPFLGKGIFVVDGAAWQHSRSVIRPVFTRSQLADFSILSLHAERFLARIPLDGTTIDLQPLFFDLTLDVATHVLLGESVNSQNAEARPEFVEHFDRALGYFATGGDVEMLGVIWPSLGARQFKKDSKFVNDYISKVIEEASMRFKASTPDTERYILLDSLLEQNLPPEQVRAEILNTLLAGRDTTASMLSDLWFELSKHPRIFKKLHTEISTEVGTNDLDYEIIKSLAYLKATLNEILRFHPVVPENARHAYRDTTLPLGGGPDQMSPVFVPRGTVVNYSTYCMHRRKDIWGEDADEFKPERWLDTVDEQGREVKGVRPGWAYLPFNGGPRVCIGQQFALLQASYVTIRLMQSIASLESRDPEPWKEKVTLTATGMNGCKVALLAKS